MTTAEKTLPLAHLGGEKPLTSSWLHAVLGHEPERSFIPVDGADIELLTWGERGKPGLLFLHGNLAHADWWSFIAPLFAATHRCAAISWSGMGRSSWRPAYSIPQNARELLAAISAAGLDLAGPPTVIGHSFGGVPLMYAAAHASERIGQAIMVDSFVPGRWKGRKGSPMPERRYTSQAKALARFRLLPDQPCDHLDLLDHIARHSLRPITDQHGDTVWSWRFDPMVNANRAPADPDDWIAGMTPPLMLIYGDMSAVVSKEDIAAFQQLLPNCVGTSAIPFARHHVMLDQPLALVAAIRVALALFARQPSPTG